MGCAGSRASTVVLTASDPDASSIYGAEREQPVWRNVTHGRAASARQDPADQRNSRCSKAPPNVTDELYEEGKQLYTESKFADALDVFLQCQTAILEDRRLERWYLERQLKRENSRMVMPSPAPTPGSPSGSRRVGRRPSLLAGLGGGRYAADQASVKSPMQVELEQKIAELETFSRCQNG